ncbi:MAG TPA: hypothetical protein VGJ07_19525 [Rugosimonospora sp.]
MTPLNFVDLWGGHIMSEHPPGGLLIIERILRDRAGIWNQIVGERGLRELIVQMLISSGVRNCWGFSVL